MTKRVPAKKTSLTHSSNPQTERTARRIARQQKALEKELLVEMGQPQTTRTRSIKASDLIQIEALTDTQADFLDAYEQGDATGYILYGSAGTGKSFLALHQALQDVMDPNTPYNRVIILRSVVEVRGIGFLPGTQEEKFAPYEHPYYSICADLFKRKDAYEKLKNNGTIEFMITTFLRGETFKDCIVVLDEMQNITLSEGNTIFTRLGNNCKIIACGDGVQTDLTKNKNDVSGFGDIMTIAKNMDEFVTFRFTSSDIVRSGFVRSWIIASEKLRLT